MYESSLCLVAAERKTAQSEEDDDGTYNENRNPTKMLAVTFYCIPALLINGGPGIWILYLCIAGMNTILRLTKAVSDFDIGTSRRVRVRMCAIRGADLSSVHVMLSLLAVQCLSIMPPYSHTHCPFVFCFCVFDTRCPATYQQRPLHREPDLLLDRARARPLRGGEVQDFVR